MHFNEIKVLYGREIRAALRERTILVNSILIPLLLYPFMLWAMFTGITFVQGQTEGFVSRVMIRDTPDDHPDLLAKLREDSKLKIVAPAEGVEEAERMVRDGELDAVLLLGPAPAAGRELRHNLAVVIVYNRSSERSAAAEQRLRTIVTRYRETWLRDQAERFGVSRDAWQQFAIQTRNVATGKEMGGFLLGLMLPLFFVIMVAIGCFYPAVDATAGERERGTWETLMSTAAARSSIMTAKYLYVATFGFVAGVLNLTAMTVSMRAVMAPLLAEEAHSIEFSLPLAALPLLVAGAILLSCFVAAGMMIFAAFARTFKEGQAMITPFYLLILVPVMFLQVPGIELTLPLAFVPIVNVTMMIREAIQGTFRWLPILVTFVIGSGAIAGCLWLATIILRFEDVVIGSFSGSFATFVNTRLVHRKGGQGEPS